MLLSATVGRSVWILLAIGLSWTPAGAQELTGDEILRRAKQAYQDLSTYRGTTAVISEMVLGDTTITRATTAEIYFARPDWYRISGLGVNGQTYHVIGNSARSELRLVFPSSEGAESMQGLLGGRVEGNTLVQDSLSAQLAIATVTGIGNRAPFYIPSLLGLARGIPLERRSPSQLVGQEPCGVTTCYVVLIEEPSMRATYWVDSTSFLFRQLKQEQTSAEWAAFADEVRRSESNGEMAPILDMVGESHMAMTYHMVFSNVQVDAPLEEDHLVTPQVR